MNYQEKVYAKYSKLVVNSKVKVNYCEKEEGIEAHQKIVSMEMRRLKYMLIYHSTGSGKTCASLQIAKNLKSTHEVYFIMPRAIVSNFYNELNSFCGEREWKYHVYSYMKFVKEFKYDKRKSYLMIIDEVHNILSSDGIIYNSLLKILDGISIKKIVLMTATPIIDDIDQLRLLTNLITDKENRLSNVDYMQKYYDNKLKLNESFRKAYGKYISYYPGAPASAYAKLSVKTVNVKLHVKQILAIENERAYMTLKKNVNELDVKSPVASFYIKLRQFSNIYIGRSLNESIRNGYCKKFESMYSKFDVKHKIFVYSSFTNSYGLGGICEYLKSKKNWKYYFECTKEELMDVKIYKYIIWSGDVAEKVKMKSLKIFNSSENLYGDKIKLVLGSPSSKEGVSFEAVTQVHILEPYWNWSRIYQIYSRAVRFCRHEKLKAGERICDVYIYLGVGMSKEFISVDKYIMHILNKKQELITNIERSLQESSFDRLLYGEKNIVR